MQSWNKGWLGRSCFPALLAVFCCLVVSYVCAQQTPAPSTGTSASPVPAPASSSAAPATPAAQGQRLTVPKPQPAIDPLTGIPLYETIEEDWSSLQIGASKLVPEPPLVAQVDEQEKFTRTLVSVKWRPGDAIDLWIIVPKGVKKPPAVLYLYGFTEDTDRFRNEGWCERATSNGVAAIGFVSALSGPRFHDRPMKQWFVSELQESLGSTVHDVQLILDYLAQRGEVDMDRIGIFGEGSGGAIAILAAAADPRIKAVDALDPWGDWPDFLAKSSIVQDDPDHGNYVKPEFLKKVAPLDPVKWLPRLTVPIRLQQVQENEVTPIESKDAIKAAAPKQAEIDRFQGLHDLTNHEGQGQLFNWIKARLQEPAKPGTVSDSKLAAAEGNASPKTPAQRP